MLEKFFSRGKARAAQRRLAGDPSVRNYLTLGQLRVSEGNLTEVVKVCEEGLRVYPENPELKRMLARARQLEREDRIKELQLTLKHSPRAALWQELCEILLDSGRVARAESIAEQWLEATRSPEAAFARASARAERFLADRRRDDGRRAFEFAKECIAMMPGDSRPLRLWLTLSSRTGAWSEARAALARLLELHPGDPTLEARFRTVLSLADKGVGLDQALLEVERSGRLVDEDLDTDRQTRSGSVRPILQDLAEDPGVHGAFYVRGATALVQGPRGATAERTARGVREVVNASRSAARRLGLGQSIEICLEGGFGTLLAQTGETGASAVWTSDAPSRKHLETLDELTGVAVGQMEDGV